MKALFYTAMALVLCGAGVMAYDSLEMSDELVQLRDSDMAQQTGGSTLYTRSLATAGNGSFASCSPSNCPGGKKTYYHARYNCHSCVSGERGVYRVSDYYTEETWCDDAGGQADCVTRVNHPDRQTHCKQGGPTCS